MAIKLKSDINVLEKDIVEEFDVEFNDVTVNVKLNCYFDDFFIVSKNLEQLKPDSNFVDNVNKELDKIAKFSNKNLHFNAKLEVFKMIIPIVGDKYGEKLGRGNTPSKKNYKNKRRYNK